MEFFRDFAEHDCCQVVLTLTMRISNYPLSVTVDAYSSALSKFMQHKRINKAFRVCSILYDLSSPSDTVIFPHVHLVCACDDSYFVKGTYINRSELQQIWRECLGVDYDPVVFTCRIFPSDDVGR